MKSPWLRRLSVILLVAAAFIAGSSLQDSLGISFSVEGLEDFRSWVQSLGWWGPVVFVLLVVFRLFVGLSSHLILTLGGLAFGAVGGAVWGGLGLFASSLVLYFLARALGTDWVERRFGSQYAAMLDRIQKVGVAAIFAITAHPLGLLTPTHLAAGVVRLDVIRFAVAVALAAPLRAVPYAFLGTAVLELTVLQSLAIAAALLMVFALPLLNARFRRWLWGES